MSSMKAYLAEKYMSGPKADAILDRVGPKKKKRKAASTSQQTIASTTFIQDDDGSWGDVIKDDDDIAEAVVASDRGFKKRKNAPTSSTGQSGWTTIQEGERAMVELDRAQEERDREQNMKEAEDEKPTIVEPFVGGLVSAKDLAKAMKPKAVEVKQTAEEIAAAQETIYRDTTGRKIDINAEKAETARKKREKEEKEAQKMEWGKGLVQREDKERLKRDIESNRLKGFSRKVDDEDLNQELKNKELWNDPAAAFMTKKRSKGPRKPEYKGPLPSPNRFGIKPGYRWDGVDRGNGFEKKYFESLNSKQRRDFENYQWGAEDM